MFRRGDNWACTCCRGARSLSAADSADPVTGLVPFSLVSAFSSVTRASIPKRCLNSWFSTTRPWVFSRKSWFSSKSFWFSSSKSITCCSSSLIRAFFRSLAVWAATLFFSFLRTEGTYHTESSQTLFISLFENLASWCFHINLQYMVD